MDLATLKIAVDARQAIAATKELNAELGNTAKEAKEAEAATLQMGTAMKAVGAGAAVLLAAGLRKVVVESIDAQYAQAQLVAALRSTQGASRQTITSLNDQAAALQRMTTYSDEAVASAQSILLTFTKIGGDTFPEATAAVVDMAARMGGDLKGAALQLGKALNDPVEGISALTRVGVSFTESQKDVIKNFVETNNLAAAQAVILRELQVEFGGSAAAARNTLGGALEGLKNSFGELFEVDAGQSQSLISLLNSMAGVFERMKDAGVTFTAVLAKAADYVSNGTLGAIFRAMGMSGGAGTGTGLGPATVGTGSLARMPGIFAPQTGPTRTPLRALTRPGAMADRLGGAGNSAKGLAESIMENDKSELQAKLDALTSAAREMADSARMVTENFLRGVQGAFSNFFRGLFTEGISSFRGLMDSFRNLVLNTVAELASKRLMDAIFGGAGGAGGLLGKLSGGAMLGIGVGAFALSKMFTGQKGPSYRANNTPRYDANGQDPRQIAARAALAANQPSAQEVRSSVSGALQEGTAVRLFGTFEAMRTSLANIEALLRSGAMMGGTSASGVDRVLGARVQSLRVASGVAVIA